MHSVAASKRSCSVIVTTELSADELAAKGFAVMDVDKLHHSELPPYQHTEVMSSIAESSGDEVDHGTLEVVYYNKWWNTIWRAKVDHSLEAQLIALGKQIEAAAFEPVIRVAASGSFFAVVMGTHFQDTELRRRAWPFG